jgi:hypothetical protein
MNQGWMTLNVVVEPLDAAELPPLGEPTYTEGDLTAWIIR